MTYKRRGGGAQRTADVPRDGSDGLEARRAKVLAGCVLISLMLIFGAFLPAKPAAASGLTYLPLQHWFYDAVERLATLGLVPLSAGATRPLTERQLALIVSAALKRLATAPDWVAARAAPDVNRLLAFLGDTGRRCRVSADGSYAGGGAGGARVDCDLGNGGIGLRIPIAPNLLEPGLVEWYGAVQIGTVHASLGALAQAWGPGVGGSLVLSATAGPIPGLRLSAEIVPGVHMTKFFGALDRILTPYGPVYFFGTRLDWDLTPNFRLGLSEVAVMPWGPMAIYHLLNPLPVFAGSLATYNLYDALGHPRNSLAAVDFDWVPWLGARLYGTLLVDNAPDRGLAGNVGLLGGVHLVDLFGGGRADLRLEGTLITRGTYLYPYPWTAHEYLYRGRFIGHPIGAGGFSLYGEVEWRLDDYSTLRLGYGYLRRFTTPESTRHAIRLQYDAGGGALQARYWAEWLWTDAGGRGGWDLWAGFHLAAGARGDRRVPAPWSPTVRGQEVADGVRKRERGGGLRATMWQATVGSRGPLAGPPGSVGFYGISYEHLWDRLSASVRYDLGTGQSVWEAAVHYQVFPDLPAARLSVLAGWGGIQVSDRFGGQQTVLSGSGPMLGLDGRVHVAVGEHVTPLYLTGRLAAGSWIGTRDFPSYLWTYHVGLGWREGRLRIGAGYRGMAWVTFFGTARHTTLRWDGYYISVSLSVP